MCCGFLFQGPDESTQARILWDIRFPRVLAAMLLGGALSVSGFLLQTFFANPIAGPFVLGISSGAKLMTALVMIFLLGRGLVAGSVVLILASFIGAMLSMGFVILIANKVNNMSILVICGIMVSYICSAVTDLVVTFADDSNIVNLHNWSLGSFFRHYLGKYFGYGSGALFLYDLCHVDGKTCRGISVRRDLCSQYGCEHKGVSPGTDPGVQYPFCLRYCFCRSGLLCGDRCSTAGKKPV